VTSISITQPAPDGNGTSVLLDGVEVRDKIRAGGLSVQFRQGFNPLVTVDLLPREVAMTVEGSIDVDERTAAILKAAGWTRAEVAA